MVLWLLNSLFANLPEGQYQTITNTALFAAATRPPAGGGGAGARLSCDVTSCAYRYLYKLFVLCQVMDIPTQ